MTPGADIGPAPAWLIFTTPAALVAAREQAKSSQGWGLNFGLGTVSEMSGEPAANEVIDTSADAYCSRGRAHAVGYPQGVLNGPGL